MERKYGPLPDPGELRPPRSHADRWDVTLAAQRPGRENRACQAALGMCWPRYRLEKPYTGDVLAYGGAVWDDLIGCGYAPDDLTRAGIAAFRAVARSVVPVEGAEGFSKPPVAGGAPSGGGSE